MPTSSYAPELFEIFRKASIEKFSLPLDTPNQAMSLRYRLNKLRSEMRKEKHFMLEVAESVSFVIEQQRPKVLICGPADLSYLDVIRKTIGPPSTEAVAAAETLPHSGGPAPASQEEVLDAYFSTTGPNDV